MVVGADRAVRYPGVVRAGLFIVCIGCGRFGFEPPALLAEGDAGPALDASSLDASPPDASPPDASPPDASPPDGAPPSGLVLHFGLDDFAGGITTDSVNGVTASCMAAPCPTARVGPVGNALDFSGSAELRVEWNPAFETPSGFTISAWFFYTGTDGAIFSRTTSQMIWNTWQLEVFNAGTGAFTTTDTGGTHDKLEGPPLALNTWTHLAGVWDGATKSLYVNGVLAQAKPWTSVLTDAQPLTIGYDINAGADQLHVTGGIDELRLYDRPLSAAEIAELAE